ncbi:MAG: hypothetical protein IH874_04670 [Candidatus Dadabacteria bacterium]|nr:hypothetical protein [Candidatus Dadabacteria bacterium]
MIPINAYKLIHIFGIMFLFLSLGAYLSLSMNNSEKGRKLAAITHGVVMIMIIIAGFGLLARLGIMSPGSWPAWAWVKLGIWVLLAGSIAVIKRTRGSVALLLWFLIPILGGIAAYMGIFKVGF